jgi:CRP-like cAMP-binding protein
VKKIELKSVSAMRGTPTGVGIPRGQTLLQAGTAGTVWRVRQGAFRLERPAGDGQTVVHLALAGDLVGVETLCAEPYACAVTALVDSVATPEPMVGEAALTATLAAAVLQQQRQSLDMALMRSGTAPVRLGHLLRLLARAFGVPADGLERKALPALKDMAQIIDSTHETVCRELPRLLPARECTTQVPAPARSASQGTVKPFVPQC